MKQIVYESLLEFQKGTKDPFEVLHLGKKKEIDEWLRRFLYTSAYKINSDWTIDIKRDFIITSGDYIKEIPEFIQFNECLGDFMFRDGNLISMRGCPYIVHGDFMVDGNKLTDLEGCPKKVEGSFWIKRNNKTFTVEEIRKLCEVGGKIIV